MKKIITTLSLCASLMVAEGLTLKSEQIAGQLGIQQVLQGFGCNGGNTSPALSWENVPEGTKSFALTMYDPDAPTGSGWWHWVVFDIPKTQTSLQEGFGNKPQTSAIQSLTNFGKPGFGGACPPQGDKAHKYEFTLYALNTDSLGLDANTNPAIVGFHLGMHTIAKSTITAYYRR